MQGMNTSLFTMCFEVDCPWQPCLALDLSALYPTEEDFLFFFRLMLNSNTWDTEAGGLKVPGQPKQYSETLLQKQTLPKQKRNRQRLVVFLRGELAL